MSDTKQDKKIKVTGRETGRSRSQIIEFDPLKNAECPDHGPYSGGVCPQCLTELRELRRPPFTEEDYV
jgi:hypothetical protein